MKTLATVIVTFCLSSVVHAQLLPTQEQTLEPASAEHFTGQANFARLPSIPSQNDVTVAVVNFTPNSFTDWHSHPTGQYLIVTDGTGRSQEWGKPIQIIKKGDVIWVAPNIKHWHGADKQTAMSHIAMSPKSDQSVIWQEKAQPTMQPNMQKSSSNLPPNTLFKPSPLHQFTAKQLILLPIAISATLGNEQTLQNHLEQALALGLTVNELTEAISHQFAYIGAPKTLNAMTTLKNLIDTRKKAGINDPQGNTATPIGNIDYYQRGTQALAELSQAPTQRPLFDFAPAVDYSIKSYLYGYLFSRDNLGAVERELVTVGSLLGLGESVNGQLTSHVTMLKNLGVTEPAFIQISTSVKPLNPDYSKNLQTVIAQ